MPTHHPSWPATSKAARHGGTHPDNGLLRAPGTSHALLMVFGPKNPIIWVLWTLRGSFTEFILLLGNVGVGIISENRRIELYVQIGSFLPRRKQHTTWLGNVVDLEGLKCLTQTKHPLYHQQLSEMISELYAEELNRPEESAELTTEENSGTAGRR